MSQFQRRQFLLSWTALFTAQLAQAQQPERTRRLGVLMGYTESDPAAQLRIAVFKAELAAKGWKEGTNLTIDIRWTSSKVDLASTFAKELVALRPDVILASTTSATAAAQRETHSIPIVFVVVSDPIGSGFVKTLARPAGNMTGFINLESSLAQKWLQLLKEVAPRVARAAVMFNPQTATYVEYYLQPLRAAATELGVKTFAAPVRSESEIAEVIAGLAREPGSGLIVLSDIFMFHNRKAIIAQSAQYKVPAIYYSANLVEDGGLIAYGIDFVDLFRRAAPYVDRILRGARAADLPVQLPTRFELVVNKNTAQALGLTIPPGVLLRADRVIE